MRDCGDGLVDDRRQRGRLGPRTTKPAHTWQRPAETWQPTAPVGARSLRMLAHGGTAAAAERSSARRSARVGAKRGTWRQLVRAGKAAAGRAVTHGNTASVRVRPSCYVRLGGGLLRRSGAGGEAK